MQRLPIYNLHKCWPTENIVTQKDFINVFECKIWLVFRSGNLRHCFHSIISHYPCNAVMSNGVMYVTCGT